MLLTGICFKVIVIHFSEFIDFTMFSKSRATSNQFRTFEKIRQSTNFLYSPLVCQWSQRRLFTGNLRAMFDILASSAMLNHCTTTINCRSYKYF